MKNLDKLLLKIENAKRLDEQSLCYALVCPASYVEEPIDSPNYNKWIVVAYLSDGNTYDGNDRNGEMLDALYFDTQEEAMKAAEEIEAVHAPTGLRIANQTPLYVTFDLPDENEKE